MAILISDLLRSMQPKIERASKETNPKAWVDKIINERITGDQTFALQRLCEKNLEPIDPALISKTRYKQRNCIIDVFVSIVLRVIYCVRRFFYRKKVSLWMPRYEFVLNLMKNKSLTKTAISFGKIEKKQEDSIFWNQIEKSGKATVKGERARGIALSIFSNIGIDKKIAACLFETILNKKILQFSYDKKEKEFEVHFENAHEGTVRSVGEKAFDLHKRYAPGAVITLPQILKGRVENGIVFHLKGHKARIKKSAQISRFLPTINADVSLDAIRPKGKGGVSITPGDVPAIVLKLAKNIDRAYSYEEVRAGFQDIVWS